MTDSTTFCVIVVTLLKVFKIVHVFMVYMDGCCVINLWCIKTVYMNESYTNDKSLLHF